MMTGCRQSPGSTCARRGMGRLWCGMGGRRPPRRQHGLLGFHQPRITQHGFPLPSAAPRRATPSPACGVFTKHETRNTNHGRYAFLPTISHDFPAPPTPLGKGPRAVRSLLSCALWRGIGRLWRGMGGRRPPRRQHGMLGFHQPRDTQHVFPLPSAAPRRAAPSPAYGVFTKHETRDTNHGFHAFHETPVTAFLAARPLLSCALWRGMGRLWRGMGGRRPPRRQHGRLCFHQLRIKQHVFHLPSAAPRRAAPSPACGVFTNHETRVTKHGLFRVLRPSGGEKCRLGFR